MHYTAGAAHGTIKRSGLCLALGGSHFWVGNLGSSLYTKYLVPVASNTATLRIFE